MRASRFIALAAAIALFLPARAGADEPETHALRIRFAEGRTLEEVGRWADALPHFEEVARARPTAHVTFHIALCYDRLGRLRNAERVYLAALAAAGLGAPDVVADAQEHLADLAVRMPRVLVALTGAIEGVTLLLDGEPVSRAVLVRTDPGPHTVVAMRGGIQVAAVAFSVLERRTKLIPLQIYRETRSSRSSPAQSLKASGGTRRLRAAHDTRVLG